MEAVLWMIFILSSIVLTVVVLLQEPKGGGLAEAFGGMGAQTFGVKATGITKFTAYVAAVFILSSILLTCHSISASAVRSALEQPAATKEAPAQGPRGMAPASKTGSQPATKSGSGSQPASQGK